jgi:hypothetical protein
MSNPTYKFFQDELTDIEIERYSDGNPIEFNPSTPELKAGADRIIHELEARGYRRLRSASRNSVSFSKPEYCLAAYIGTTVNPFSFSEKIWNWSNKFAKSYKYITIHEVYRGNGTTNNATFRLSVCCSNSDKAPVWYTDKWHNGGKINQFGIEIPKEYDFVSVSGSIHDCEEIRKFKPDVSDKVLKRILDKAIEVIESKKLFNPECWEADHNNFHEDTSIEYKEYQKSKK